MKKIFGNSLLFLILFLATFLRLYNIDKLPASLNPDEAALGYTSYSLLKTGADEHGKFLPLSLESFGDWKLPLYSYLGVVSVALFDLNEFSVRFISTLSGIIGVILIYFISLNLFRNKSIAIIAALFCAISPWNIYFSRAAYEVNLATTLFLGGILCFFKSFNQEKPKRKLIILAFLLFALTMFTYHSYIILAPIFVIVLLISYWRQIASKISYIAIFIFVILAIFFAVVASSGNDKLSTLIINDKNIIYERVEKLRGDVSNFKLDRFILNKYLGVSYQILQNYINSFSPNFLFDKGGEKLIHNIGSFGNLYLIDAFFILTGFAFLFWNKEKSIKLILIWLILSPIPSAITKDAPNSTRLFSLMPLFVLVGSYGAYYLFSLFKKNKGISIFFKLSIILLFLINFIYFLDIYFVHFNIQRARFWHYGYREAVKLSDKYPAYDVVMRGPENFPYIYFLFYKKYDPILFRKEVKYYPVTSEGFKYIKTFGKFNFPEKINYEKLNKDTVYIDDTRLDDKKNSIVLPSGEVILGYNILEN